MRVLWFDDRLTTPIPYDPAEHPTQTHSFLYWASTGEEDEMLIAGSGCYGRQNGKIRDGSHKSLAAYALECGVAVPMRKPDGAGNLASRYKVVSGWDSVGYDVKTPPALRPHIAAALGVEA